MLPYKIKRLQQKKVRCEQGSNLRGKFPLDFKSNALTTRPSQHMLNAALKYRTADDLMFTADLDPITVFV